MTNLKLIYIHYLGLNADLKRQYSFYFVQQNLELCNDNWKEELCGLFNDKFIPNKETIIYTLVTSIPLGLITENLCLGMKHAIDNVVALAWEDISDYEEYPENGRLIFHYGISLDETEKLLKDKNEKFLD